MNTLLSLPDRILRHWQHDCPTDSETTVLPDGCRDLIVHMEPGGAPRWFVSALTDSVLQVPCRAGACYIGYRFHPASIIDEFALLSAAQQSDGDAALLAQALADHSRVDIQLAEALACLARIPAIAQASRALGVSQRTLERLVSQRSGRPPTFWRTLARARQCAAALSAAETPLAEIAADHGYADQAHMNRAFRRWFATTPARLRADPVLLAMALEPGYA